LNKAAHEVDGRVRKVIVWQVIGGVAAAAVFFVSKGWGPAQAALCGGLIGTATTLLLSRSVKKAGRAADDTNAGMRILYLGAVQRFFFVLGAFALGVAVLKLEPLALCAGFALAQVGYLINARGMTRSG
jgi:F0F1-type ATP synthase assembly protein I